MASRKPYIGCKVGLISKAQNRYEGILYTIDKINSTVVLAKVKCFGTERRPTDRPTAPKNDIYDFITFRGSDIKDIALCEPPRSHHGLPPDPAIIQSSSAGSSSIYSTLEALSPVRMSAYNQLAASSLLNQQYAAALGSVLQDMPVRRGPMVEKAVQTVQMERLHQSRGATASQEQRWDRGRPQRTQRENPQTGRAAGGTMRSGPGLNIYKQETLQQNTGSRPPSRRRQGAGWRRSRGRGQLIVANVPSPILKFDTDFDFDLSNAQFLKEELEREVNERMNIKGALLAEVALAASSRFLKNGSYGKIKEGMHSTAESEHFGPKCYYDKAKSFFDNISSSNGFRLTWAEERKRNLETFGVPGRFFRGRGFRGAYNGRRGQGSAQMMPSQRTRSGRL